MLNVGLTGGIGSGKSTVASLFSDLGVPVYNADERARQLMQDDPDLMGEITEAFGPDSYHDGALNRPYLASIVFQDKNKLNVLNSIVHPRVREDYRRWSQSVDALYNIREAAILFESGANEDCDLVIFVKAAEDERIKRVMKRDGVSEKAVRARMENQWKDEEKEKLSHLFINNNDGADLPAQVRKLHEYILEIVDKE